MTRCSTWLKYLYLASTFLEDWKMLKANLREKKKQMWKGDSYGKTRNSRSTILMSERRRNENLFCHGLWWPGRTFISLWRIDTVCVWGKGWLNQYWNITWKKAGFFFFIIMEVWMSLSIFFRVLLGVCVSTTSKFWKEKNLLTQYVV